VRRFYGDYLDVKANSLLMNALGTGSQEKVLFSYKGKVVHHPGLLKRKKLSPRTVIITENAVYFVMYTKVKGEIVTKLDCSLPINGITGCTFSPLGDDFIILHTEEGDVVFECPFKSEILAWTCSKNPSIQTNIKFEEKIKYIVYKKKKNEKVTFIESTAPEHVEGLFKKGKFYTPPGLPPDSRPTELSKKQGEPILSNRPLPTAGGKTNPGRSLPQPNTPPSNVNRPVPSTIITANPTKTTPPPPNTTGRSLPQPNPPNSTGRSLPQPNPPPSNAQKPKCKALYNYTSQENDELTIRKGDVITIIKEHPDWWEGELNGTVGVFPANYVEKI
jgi:myosin-1